MEQSISRSEKKRQAKTVETLARELVELSPVNIRQLPCDDFLKNELLDAKNLKLGALKRQIKYITKNIRDIDYSPLLDFLTLKKGSKLKETKDFHALEYLRDQILVETFEAQFDAEKNNIRLDSHWHSDTVEAVCTKIPGLDAASVKEAAIKFAVTRKPVYKREIFRLMKAAQEQIKFKS